VGTKSKTGGGMECMPEDHGACQQQGEVTLHSSKRSERGEPDLLSSGQANTLL
jgi:hypothetical protein